MSSFTLCCAPRCSRNGFFHCSTRLQSVGGSPHAIDELRCHGLRSSRACCRGTRNIFHYCLHSCADGGDISQKAATRWNELRRVRKVLGREEEAGRYHCAEFAEWKNASGMSQTHGVETNGLRAAGTANAPENVKLVLGGRRRTQQRMLRMLHCLVTHTLH